MNIITFLKTHIPSFEDEFVQSESEREMENAPASARRSAGRVISSIGVSADEISTNDLSTLDLSLMNGWNATDGTYD